MNSAAAFPAVKVARCGNIYPGISSLLEGNNLQDSRIVSNNTTLPSGGLTMLLILAIALLVLWFLGFVAFHVTTAFIHFALVVAVVLFVWHLLAGRRTAV